MPFFGGGASVDLASPPAIGNTTPNTGKFTTLEATTSLQVSTSGFLFGGTNLFEQRNSTSAQTFRIYNTFTDASNYERGFMRWSSNVLAIGAEAAGTGTQRTVEFRIGATAVLTLSGNQGTFVSRLSCNNLALGSNFIYTDPVGNGIRLTDTSGSTNASGGYFLYNAYTNTTNNERGFVRWGSNRFQVGTISIGTGTARTCEVTFYTSASDPTSADITSGYFSVWKNSGTGTVKLWVNDGGTMKSVALA